MLLDWHLKRAISLASSCNDDQIQCMYSQIRGGSRVLGWGVLNCATESKFDHTHLNPAHSFHLKCATFNNFVYDL